MTEVNNDAIEPAARGPGEGSDVLIVMRPNDVLCSRGTTQFNHSGNVRFREMITQSISEYRAAGPPPPSWTSFWTTRLVEAIHNSGGRFLRRENKQDEWYELSVEESQLKVGHALRDASELQRRTGPIPVPADPLISDPNHFPTKLHNMLASIENNENGHAEIVSWQPHGFAFLIHNKEEFIAKVLPQWFCRLKASTFVRQLHKHGFRRLAKQGPDQGAYWHPKFTREDLELAKTMRFGRKGAYWHPKFTRENPALAKTMSFRRQPVANEQEYQQKKSAAKHPDLSILHSKNDGTLPSADESNDLTEEEKRLRWEVLKEELNQEQKKLENTDQKPAASSSATGTSKKSPSYDQQSRATASLPS